MRVPRLTVRKLLAIVLVVAAGLAVGVEGGRIARVRRAMAARHTHDWSVLGGGHPGMEADDPKIWGHVVAGLKRKAEYHDAMRRKWEHGADRPWLPVEPDPPGPPLPRETVYVPGTFLTAP